MHLLYLQQFLILPNTSGSSRSFELAREWVKKGMQVTILTTDAHFPASEKVNKVSYQEREGIQLMVLPVAYQHKMSFLRRIFSFLEFLFRAWNLSLQVKNVDAVLAYSAPLSVGELGRRIAQKKKIPFFFEVGDVWPDVPIGMGIIQNSLLKRFLHARANKMYAQAQQIFPFSEGMKAQIMAHGVAEHKITVCHNGFSFTESFTSAPLSELDRKHSPIQILYAGSFGKANGVWQLVEAAKLLAHRADIHFTLIGSGNDEQEVLKRISAYKLPNLSHYAWMNKAELQTFWQNADIGIVSIAPFPALEANSSTKFFDYLALGLPVICNFEGWMADYLREYTCGLTAPLGDIAALAKQIEFLADNPTLRKQMSQNGQIVARRFFDRKDIAERMYGIVNKKHSW